MLQALRSEAHRHLGFGAFAEYEERLFGYSPRATEEKLRVARALESLPDTNRALREGELSWSAARELTRVTTRENKTEWLASARNLTVRETRTTRFRWKLGDRPADPVRPNAKQIVLRFEVNAETAATFRDAVAHLRRKSDQSFDDDSLLLAMAREILQGPTDEGRGSYQILVTACEHCGQGFQQAAGELVPLEPEVVEMARCDAQLIIVGTVSTGLVFRHADGSAYGDVARFLVENASFPDDCDRFELAFRGLRGLGSSEKGCRRALDRVNREGGERSIGTLIRAALELLV